MMKKEYYEITYNDPFFEGYFTIEKLLGLIELMEKDGWKFKGDKKYLKRISYRTGYTGRRNLKERVLAVLERDKNLNKGSKNGRQA